MIDILRGSSGLPIDANAFRQAAGRDATYLGIEFSYDCEETTQALLTTKYLEPPFRQFNQMTMTPRFDISFGIASPKGGADVTETHPAKPARTRS